MNVIPQFVTVIACSGSVALFLTANITFVISYVMIILGFVLWFLISRPLIA